MQLSLWIKIPALLFLALCIRTAVNANEPRFKLTLEVDTPTGLKSGSSVITASFQETSWGLPEATGVRTRLRGEAVFVDLGAGRSAIMLLTEGLASLPGWLFQPQKRHAYEGAQNLRGFAEIPVDGITLGQHHFHVLPDIVTFTDLNDPTTAKIVHGRRSRIEKVPGTSREEAVYTPIREMERTFGPGYAFRRATLEMVQPGIWPFNQFSLIPWPRWLFGKPLTTGIEGRLVWIGNYASETTFERRLCGEKCGLLMPGLKLKRKD